MNDDGCGCGCFGLVAFCILLTVAAHFTPRTSTTIPPTWALVVTAYSRESSNSQQYDDGKYKAGQRTTELQRAGWSSANYRYWRSPEDGNEFWMVYVKDFLSESELNDYWDWHRRDLHRFDSVRVFSWPQEAVIEASNDYNGRVAFTVILYLSAFAGCAMASFIIGWPLGVASGHGASAPEPRGCLASFLPGYAAGYRAGVIGAAKRLAAEEASRGDHCVARRSLIGETGEIS